MRLHGVRRRGHHFLEDLLRPEREPLQPDLLLEQQSDSHGRELAAVRRAVGVAAAGRSAERRGGFEGAEGRLGRAERRAARGASHRAGRAAAGVGGTAPVRRRALLGLRVDDEHGGTGDRRLLQVRRVGLEGGDVARRRQGPVGQLVPGRGGGGGGVFDLLRFGERVVGVHADRRRRRRGRDVVFWARVDLRQRGQAPPLLRGVGVDGLDLQVLHGGRGDGARRR